MTEKDHNYQPGGGEETYTKWRKQSLADQILGDTLRTLRFNAIDAITLRGLLDQTTLDGQAALSEHERISPMVQALYTWACDQPK